MSADARGGGEGIAPEIGAQPDPAADEEQAQPSESGWTPEFEGQRPPFEDGNFAAVKHGARSQRKVEELARQIDVDLLGRAPWVAEYPEALGAYARAESVARLLFADIAKNGAYGRNGEFRASLFAKYTTAENAAARHRDALGLTPRSEAQVARDRAVAASASVDVVGELIKQGRATRAHRPDAERTTSALENEAVTEHDEQEDTT